MATTNTLEFTDSVIDAELMRFEALDFSNLGNLIDSRYDFQGFQPKTHLKTLLTKKREQKIEQDVFQADIVKMIAMFLKIGNPNPNNLQKRTSEVQGDIDALKLRYGLAVSARGKPSSVVTVPRVAATFVILTMRIAERIGVRDYSGPFNSNQLPWFMKVSVFPAIIPHSFPPELKSMLLQGFLAFSLEQSMALSKKDADQLPQLLVEQKNIIVSVNTSSSPNESSRSNYIKTLDWSSALQKIGQVLSLLDQRFPNESGTISIRQARPLLIAQGIALATPEKSKRSEKGKLPEKLEEEMTSESDGEASETEPGKSDESKFPKVMVYPKGLNSKKRKEFRSKMAAQGFVGIYKDAE
jgi:hypothetical protein